MAEYPMYLSFNPEQDGILFTNARDAPPGSPDVAGNGVYYFDARSGRQYRVTGGSYPSFSNGDRTGTPNPATPPWSQDGRLAVVG